MERIGWMHISIREKKKVIRKSGKRKEEKFAI
jgi:hypothetical protein